MMRIVYVLKRASLQICILVVSVVACQIASRLVADQVTSAGPRIADVRVGLMNHYKLGCWTPVSVDVTGVTNAEMAKNLRIDVTVADSDGVNTTASAPVSLQSDQDGRWSAVVYTQVGRVGSPIQVSLLNKDNPIDDRTLLPSATSNSEAAVFPISATSELIVFLGKSPNGIKGAFPDRTASGSQIGRKLLKINSTAALPKHWFGYDGVDVLVMSVADGQLYRELAADKVRFAALQRWVNLGGRLVVLCNGKKAQAMIGAGGPLSAFAPGKFVEVVPLRDTGPLEHFANSATINGTAIEVPRLTDVKGNIDAYAGRRPTDLPLVVRSARGFGEITFVGVEFEEPPLSAWSGRNAFLQALLRPYLPDSEVSDSTQKLVASGFNDLSGALRQQLGRKFKLLMPVGFPIVAALAIAYLFVLGPVDYLFIHRWIRRPWVAWISFPVVVAGFAAIALAFGNWSRGAAGPRVNQLVLVDYDTIGRQARGTFWSTVYSPTANQFNLKVRLAPNTVDEANSAGILFSWWGLPGAGIGGMQTGSNDLGILRGGYYYGPRRNSLEQVPILASATKSLLARWDGTAPSKIEAQLTDDDGLVVGTVTNRSGAILRNAQLFYGSWAYRLGNLNDGEQVEVSEQLSPRRAKTLVTHDALGASEATPAPEEGRVFSAERASATDILTLMMFYETAGGFGFAHVPNRYQAYCDLSRQLNLGRAILIAEEASGGTQLIDSQTDEPIGDNSLDTSTVVYRFLLPVERISTP